MNSDIFRNNIKLTAPDKRNSGFGEKWFISHLPDNDDSLSLEKRLGDDGGETTKEMTAAIDDQRLGGETHLSRD